MFHVAICDDEKAICTGIESCLAEYSGTDQIETTLFDDGKALCCAMRQGACFDLVFLDIEMSSMDGVSAGRVIREELQNEKTHIVYISGKQQYAMELFQIRPLHFLVKPFTKQQVMEVLDKAMRLTTGYRDYFEFQSEQNYHRCFYSDIMYFESSARKIMLHTQSEIFTFYGKLNDIEKETGEAFLRIHQSFLVNPLYIIQYKADEIMLKDGRTLPISKSLRSNVRKTILKDWRR